MSPGLGKMPKWGNPEYCSRADVTGLRGTVRIDNPLNDLKVFSINYQAFLIDNQKMSM